MEHSEVWPSFEEFATLAEDHRVIPVVKKILSDDTSPVSLYRRMAPGAGSFILESAQYDGSWTRWSFVGLSASAHIVAREGRARWLGDVPQGLTPEGTTTALLEEALRVLHTPKIPGLPPLTGGLVGALGWDTVFDWEPHLRRHAPYELTSPDSACCLVKDMLAIDHKEGVIYLIANAVNTNNRPTGLRRAWENARERIEVMQEALTRPSSAHPAPWPQAGNVEISLRTPQDAFEAKVEAAHKAIVDGEVFQVVLSQRAQARTDVEPLEVYRLLRTINPSPYMYLLAMDDGEGDVLHIVGSSPETLMRLTDGEITTFPIAGSRPRGANLKEDRELARELLADEKERSEHVMLVDLSRNDLAKVCVPGTVSLAEFMQIKKFSHIQHISSTVVGQLAPEMGPIDAFRATFPAGTLSGAPKPRAIELIDALEDARRGIYGGVIGYFDFSGNADLAIAIRTALMHRGNVSVQAGAGIVADSQPTTEFIETRNKAAAALSAVDLAVGLSRGELR